MKARLLVVMASSAMVLPAVADSGFTPGKGESSGGYHAMPSIRTAEQVRAELEAWKRNPVTPDGLQQINGDIGWVYVGTGASGKTRAQVRQELAEFRRNPVTADGWMFTGGERGWVFVGADRRDGATASSADTTATPVAAGQRSRR